MKLRCRLCGKVFIRTKTDVKRNMTKRGYRSYCVEKDKYTFAQEVK